MPLVQNPSPALQRLISQYDLEELPESEPMWQVPKPVIVPPTPPPQMFMPPQCKWLASTFYDNTCTKSVADNNVEIVLFDLQV